MAGENSENYSFYHYSQFLKTSPILSRLSAAYHSLTLIPESLVEYGLLRPEKKRSLWFATVDVSFMVLRAAIFGFGICTYALIYGSTHMTRFVRFIENDSRKKQLLAPEKLAAGIHETFVANSKHTVSWIGAILSAIGLSTKNPNTDLRGWVGRIVYVAFHHIIH